MIKLNFSAITLKPNAKYGIREYEHMRLAMVNIQERVTKGSKYSYDMRSSVAACLEDIILIAKNGLGDK